MRFKGGPTQDEVMAVSVHKLGIKRGDVVADIGCGTGKVAMAMGETAEKVYAVDIRKEAVETCLVNLKTWGRTNIEVRQQDGLEFLEQCDRLNGAFVGGTKHLPEMLALLKDRVRGRIVVNTVLLRSMNQAVEGMIKLDMFKEAVQVQVGRSHGIAGSIMFRPIDPVFIIVGEVL
ncbi:MAG: SAM-dependent methyltransferase [Methanomassiliicoccus sp.]|nr:SAM-dependent methyltransferase [Methanomassiliicoccus sp.]